MAKLSFYFSLCPIIDQKSLLGINEDIEAENVIVTLGKNIAIKYKISDQKQLNSWRTKDKFTSPVIYFKEEEVYCAVFNQTYLRIWKDEEKLDKLKKYKFLKQVHTLLRCGDASFIIFNNGCISLLKKAFAERKDFVPEDLINLETEEIIDILSISVNNTIYVGLLVKGDGNIDFICNVFEGSNHRTLNRIHLNKPNVELRGYVLNQFSNNEVNILTLCSDRKLYSYSLKQKTENFISIIDSVSTKDSVTMIALNEDYLAMYGDNCNDDGANLIIYNIQFKVTQYQQPLKMFTSGTKLWCLQNNIFLCMGQNVAVIPYFLDTEQLAALVGSHKLKAIANSDVEIVEDLVVSVWDEKAKKKKNKTLLTEDVKKNIEEYITQGWSEAAICEALIPKCISEKDLNLLKQVLNSFNDIPEVYIAKLLNFILSANETLFVSSTSNQFKVPTNLGPIERCVLIDKLLSMRFSDALLLPQLRKFLDITNALLLLRYISFLLSEDGHSIQKCGVVFNERKLIEWGTILLDANYQKILLTKDEKIIEVLIYFNNLVNAHLCCLDELQQVVPLLKDIQKGKSNPIQNLNLNYSVENLKLY